MSTMVRKTDSIRSSLSADVVGAPATRTSVTAETPTSVVRNVTPWSAQLDSATSTSSCNLSASELGPSRSSSSSSPPHCTKPTAT